MTTLNQSENNGVNQVNIVGNTPINTPDKYEQLFKAYEDFQKDTTIQQKNAMNFWGFINKEKSGFILDGIVNTYDKLGNRSNLDSIKKIFQEETDKKEKKRLEEKKEEESKNEQIALEKVDRLTGLLYLVDAYEEFKKDIKYPNKGQTFFLNFLADKKTKNNDKSLTYFGFEPQEIEIKDGKIEKPNSENIKQENKIFTKIEEKDTTETAEESILTITKTRLRETIEKYIDKIKELKTSKDEEKKTLEEEIKALREELKTEKNTYEKVKRDFMVAKKYNFENFTQEDLAKAPTQRVRYNIRENKLFNTPKITKMKTYRRNMTIQKLIKKFNNIGTDEKNGVRFIMGFEKERLLRYTSVKMHSIVDSIGTNIGLQMNPEKFHQKFNAGRKNIFAILDENTGDKVTKNEENIIAAIKNRINYYGASYARQRANQWIAPFIDAEKNTEQGNEIFQKNINQEFKNVA